MRDPQFRRSQREGLYADHVAPINRLVDELASNNGPGWMPHVAPVHGGVGSRVLLLARDPGPAVKDPDHVDRGFLCVENDDPTAERTATLLQTAKIPISATIPWNAYPWYINRAPTAAQLLVGLTPLRRLLEQLVDLRVVLLLGAHAQRSWHLLLRETPSVAAITAIRTRHASRQAFIGTAEQRTRWHTEQLEDFRRAAILLRDHPNRLEGATGIEAPGTGNSTKKVTERCSRPAPHDEPEHAGLSVTWPVEPLYNPGERYRGWVSVKLRAADWYIDTLTRLETRVGLQRYAGVDMALDGALTALCGAFDAARAAVIAADEEHRLERLEDHKYDDRALYKSLTRHQRSGLLPPEAGLLRRELDEALRLKSEPWGWLTQVRRLRNATVHRQTLPRHIDHTVGQAQAEWQLWVSTGATEGHPAAPVPFMQSARAQMAVLSQRLLAAADRIAPGGMVTTAASEDE